MDSSELFGGRGRGEAEQPRGPKNSEIEEQLEQLEKDMHELRAQYELYFMGIEKREPIPQRDKIKSRLRRLRDLRINNTRLKFRAQNLKARMISLENYWMRTLRQREAGKYKRDQIRVARREQERQAQAIRAAAGQTGTSDKAKAPPPGRPRASTAADLTDAKLKGLYDTYIGARRRCGESTNVRYEDLAASLRKQVPKLIQKTGASTVEFKVVIRKGKAVLKALPKG